MALPADQIRLVPPAETTHCEWCGARHLPGREFVAYNSNPAGVGEDDAPGVIETVDARASGSGYRVRGADGQTTTIVVHNTQVCSECITQAAREIGWGDTRPFQAAQVAAEEESMRRKDRINDLARELANTQAALRDAEARAAAYLDGKRKRPAKSTAAA